MIGSVPIDALAFAIEGPDYITLGGKIIIALLATIGVLGGAWMQWVAGPRLRAQLVAAEKAAERHSSTDAKVDQLLQQIKNSHDKNLRDDLDEKFASLETQIRDSDSRTHARIDALTDQFVRHLDGK